MKKEEYLDIVDKNNNLTGESKPRSLVHKDGLWHRIVAIYFFRQFNNEIQFLVHLRSKSKDTNPDKWDTRFGGQVKAGETIKKATIDEIEDETGLNIQYKDLIKGYWRKRQSLQNNNEFGMIHYLEFNGDIDDLNFNDGEVQKAKWLSVEEISDLMKTQPDKWTGKSVLNEVVDFLENKLK